MSPRTSCVTCGTNPSIERPSFTWSLSVEQGRRAWLCAPCSRRHLRLIETRRTLA